MSIEAVNNFYQAIYEENQELKSLLSREQFERFREGKSLTPWKIRQLNEICAQHLDTQYIRCSRGTYNAYYLKISPMERFMDKKFMDMGKQNLLCAGVPMAPQEGIDDNVFEFMNEETLLFRWDANDPRP